MVAYEIYTNEGCIPCHQAKEKLIAANVEFKEFVIGRDITRDEVIQKFPNAKFTPVIYNERTKGLIQWQVLDLVLLAEKMMEKEKNEQTT